jgi:hypothetical protein
LRRQAGRVPPEIRVPATAQLAPLQDQPPATAAEGQVPRRCAAGLLQHARNAPPRGSTLAFIRPWAEIGPGPKRWRVCRQLTRSGSSRHNRRVSGKECVECIEVPSAPSDSIGCSAKRSDVGDVAPRCRRTKADHGLPQTVSGAPTSNCQSIVFSAVTADFPPYRPARRLWPYTPNWATLPRGFPSLSCPDRADHRASICFMPLRYDAVPSGQTLTSRVSHSRTAMGACVLFISLSALGAGQPKGQRPLDKACHSV